MKKQDVLISQKEVQYISYQLSSYCFTHGLAEIN